MKTCVTIADSLDRFRVSVRVLFDMDGKATVLMFRTNFKAEKQQTFVDAMVKHFGITVVDTDKYGFCVLMADMNEKMNQNLAMVDTRYIFEETIVLDY